MLRILEFLISLLFTIVLLGFLTIITIQLAVLIDQKKAPQPPVVERNQLQNQDQEDDAVPTFDPLVPFPV